MALGMRAVAYWMGVLLVLLLIVSITLLAAIPALISCVCLQWSLWRQRLLAGCRSRGELGDEWRPWPKVERE